VIRGAPLGNRFQKATFSSFKVTEYNSAAFNACKDLVEGKNTGVVLIGPVGVGKTHLLVALACEYDRVNSYVPDSPMATRAPMQVPSASELIATAHEEPDEDTSTPSLHIS